MVLFITRLAAASTKAKWFYVLVYWLTNWWYLNFHNSETSQYILMKLLHITVVMLCRVMSDLNYAIISIGTHCLSSCRVVVVVHVVVVVFVIKIDWLLDWLNTLLPDWGGIIKNLINLSDPDWLSLNPYLSKEKWQWLANKNNTFWRLN